MMKMDYPRSIEKEESVQVGVRVIPKAEVGKVEYELVGEPKHEPCEGILSTGNDFIICPMICLKIPVHFSSEAMVVSAGIDFGQKSKDHEPYLRDDMQNHEGFMIRRMYQKSGPARQFTRNYLLTYQNNPETT